MCGGGGCVVVCAEELGVLFKKFFSKECVTCRFQGDFWEMWATAGISVRLAEAKWHPAGKPGC